MRKTWFITGASRGIGFEIACAALSAGNNVVTTARNARGLKALFRQYNEAQIACIELDVNNGSQVLPAITQAVARFGGIDILVNNAGFGQLGYFETVEPEAISQQFATNVFGLMQVTRAVLPIMREQQNGHIINLSSIGGVLGFEGASVYCATKYAVEGFSESLALEVARFGIKLTIVEPGFFRTDFLDRRSVSYGDVAIPDYSAIASAQTSQYDQYSHAQPGDPKKLARLIVDIASSDSPPMRLVAGTDALAMARQSIEQRIQNLEQWAETSVTTDF